ncbi:MAG: class I SAM-dependent methyltransferase [Vulcanimicrobiota bacterium]
MDQLLDQLSKKVAQPWGDVLDAGTGNSSWDWLLKQNCRSRTGITAEEPRAESLRKRSGMGPDDRVLVGLWQDPGLLAGQQFDVILADYLLGACDRYAPHFQEQLLERLVGCCRGWIFLIGLEPIPAPANPGQQILFEVAQLRDAVQLLLGYRPHREIPQAWVERQLARLGAQLVWSERYHNLYDENWVEREVASLELNLQLLEDGGLAQVLRRRCHGLRRKAAEHLRKAVSYSFDYLLGISVGQPATTGPLPH